MCFQKMESHTPNEYHKTAKTNFDQYSSADHGDLYRKVSKTCRELSTPPGVHSHIAMRSAGFEYTNNGNAACCQTCGLEVSGWTSDMKPFTIHNQHSPTCPFVLSMLPSEKKITDPTMNLIQTISTSNNGEPPLKRLKPDTTAAKLLPNTLVELNTLKEVRKRTFSHWPHRSSAFSSQMIEAGFFNCNVSDRVICIYCNIICQQWTPNSDDPYEVHKTLSPKCPYVIAMLTSSQTSSISIINETSANVDSHQCHAVVYTAACNTNYIEISKRYASFATCPNENLPPIDDLVKAGFFFTGTKTIVTCFYCNGSLQNWGPNDNPTIEHARWFPNCAYAKQLCGAELYRKIQESKRAQSEKARTNDSSNRFDVIDGNLNCVRWLKSDERTLSRLVAARLDLPVQQRLLDHNFKLSIIKRCWEDQLRLKYEDFVSDCDLLLACTILQKQIEYIDGKKENIIVPSLAMKRIQEGEQAEVYAREQTATGSSSINSSSGNDVEMATTTSAEVSIQNHRNNASNRVSCRLCRLKEWYPACLPCGHVHLKTLRKHSLQS